MAAAPRCSIRVLAPMAASAVGDAAQAASGALPRSSARRVSLRDRREECLGDLHVLLRHRLLRQPGGFEGVPWIEIGPDRDRLAVPDLGHEGQGRLRFGAAGLAACARGAIATSCRPGPGTATSRCEPRRRSRRGRRSSCARRHGLERPSAALPSTRAAPSATRSRDGVRPAARRHLRGFPPRARA